VRFIIDDLQRGLCFTSMTQRANVAESFEQSLIPELMGDLAGCEVLAPCSRRVPRHRPAAPVKPLPIRPLF
jgi:hypothetical protein